MLIITQLHSVQISLTVVKKTLKCCQSSNIAGTHEKILMEFSQIGKMTESLKSEDAQVSQKVSAPLLFGFKKFSEKHDNPNILIKRKPWVFGGLQSFISPLLFSYYSYQAEGGIQSWIKAVLKKRI